MALGVMPARRRHAANARSSEGPVSHRRRQQSQNRRGGIERERENPPGRSTHFPLFMAAEEAESEAGSEFATRGMRRRSGRSRFNVSREKVWCTEEVTRSPFLRV